MKILPTGIAVIEGDTHASKWIEEQGRLDYDGEVAKTIEPLLKPGDTALDVGAMLGAYSIGMKRAVGPTGHVFAFEPNPQAFECLAHNCPDVQCFNMALGDREAMCVSVNSGRYPNNAGASFVETDHRGVVHMDTLDSFWSSHGMGRIAFIKVDIEGYEPEFIQGAKKTLREHRPIIFIELNYDVLLDRGHERNDVIDPLMAIGYTHKFLSPKHSFSARDWPQLDLLMMP